MMKIIGNRKLTQLFGSGRQHRTLPAIAIALLLIFPAFIGQANAAEKKNAAVGFPVVAYHVDLRAQIMPMVTLKALAREISDLGFNAIIMEWEATYPFQKHSIISNRYAYTREEVKDFIAYCEKLGLDVIPLQQSLGHTEYILRHERYAYLRADERDFSQVDPTRISAARELFEELYGDMLSLHKSKYVHIGGDETRILDCDRCKKAWAELSDDARKSKLYVDYMKMIAGIVAKQGKIPLLWADMILSHPDAVADMPKEAVYIDWNYGWKFDYFGVEPTKLIEKYGLKFWGASAMRSHPDDYHVTTWKKHLKNQADFIPYARNAGYEGMILTSWATSGIYGYEWFSFSTEVVELYPMRLTYPHAYPHEGFRMNISAFSAALKQKEPIVPDDFAREYAKERFGLTEKESAALWEILQSEDLHKKIPIGTVAMSGEKKPASKHQLAQSTLEAVRKLQAKLKQIEPKRNQQEFAHYALQVDFREFYLSFREIEHWVQSEAFTSKHHAEAAKRLQALLDRAVELNGRFAKMFRGALYDSEIAQLNEYRSKKIQRLQQRLARQR